MRTLNVTMYQFKRESEETSYKLSVIINLVKYNIVDYIDCMKACEKMLANAEISTRTYLKVRDLAIKVYDR